MYTRGSGFTGFSYATLTLTYLLVVGRIFFAVPSQSNIICGAILAVLFLVDSCIILAMHQIRVEEGWVGVISVIWATFIAVYAVIQNRAVESGKREEEQRLTGREETRRSLGEWVAVFVELVVVVVMVLVAILLTATLILRARDASLSPPGKKYYVSGDRYQVHLACVGDFSNTTEKSTTILLEGSHNPVESSLQPFVDSIYQTGSIKRYCYWDRPGLGWSDNAPSPFSAGMAADVLAEALSKATNQDQTGSNNTDDNWILVSAGIGGIYTQIFASRNFNLPRIHGIMLIDALHEDYLVRHTGRAGQAFSLWLRGVISPLGIDTLASALFRGRTRKDRVIGRNSRRTSKVIKAEFQESLVADSLSLREVQTARTLGLRESSIPLVVVSSGIEVDRSQMWAEKQRDLTTVTENLIAWDVVEGAPHEVWRDGHGGRVLERRLRELVGSD